MKKLAIYPLAGAAVAAALVCFGGAQAGATQREINDARNTCSAMIGRVKSMNSYEYWKTTEDGRGLGAAGGPKNEFYDTYHWTLSGGEYYDKKTKAVYERTSIFEWGNKTVNFTPNNFCLTTGKTSGGREFILTFQKDGNLVLYSHTGAAQWSSNTQGKGTRLAFQNDRNIVVYDKNNKAVWASSWYWTLPRRGTKINQPGQHWWDKRAKAQPAPEWFQASRRVTTKPQDSGYLRMTVADRTMNDVSETHWAPGYNPNKRRHSSATYGWMFVSNWVNNPDGTSTGHMNIVASFDN